MRKASVGGQGLCTLLQSQVSAFPLFDHGLGVEYPHLVEAILNRQHNSTTGLLCRTTASIFLPFTQGPSCLFFKLSEINFQIQTGRLGIVASCRLHDYPYWGRGPSDMRTYHCNIDCFTPSASHLRSICSYSSAPCLPDFRHA